jgi:hypothetical protein
MFENRVLRVIFGTEGDDITGEWRKLHIEELNYTLRMDTDCPALLKLFACRLLRKLCEILSCTWMCRRLLVTKMYR